MASNTVIAPNRVWGQLLCKTLISINFTQSAYERCLFTKNNIWILVYVDDLVLISKDAGLIEKTATQLSKHFDLKSLGNIDKFLGLRIKRNSNFISLSQSDLIKKLLKETNLQDCKGISTPIACLKKLKANRRYPLQHRIRKPLVYSCTLPPGLDQRSNSQ